MISESDRFEWPNSLLIIAALAAIILTLLVTLDQLNKIASKELEKECLAYNERGFITRFDNRTCLVKLESGQWIDYNKIDFSILSKPAVKE